MIEYTDFDVIKTNFVEALLSPGSAKGAQMRSKTEYYLFESDAD